jgi:SAM-dependent methyltransferase
MKKTYLDKISKNDLKEFLNLYRKVVEFDVDDYYEKALDLLDFYSGKKKTNEIINAMEEHWYKSLRQYNMPDYSIYESPIFVLDMWACWKLYSRNYIRNMVTSKNKINGERIYDYLNKRIKNTVDVGCGIGYTSVALSEVFRCGVYATNIRDSAQWKFCKLLFGNMGHIGIADNVKKIGNHIKKHERKIDLLFASEYFEHFADPINHVSVVISSVKPKFIAMANAFGADAIGHFDTYPVGDKKVEGKNFGRYFNDHIRKMGYETLETGFYNNRPYLFKRNDVK